MLGACNGDEAKNLDGGPGADAALTDGQPAKDSLTADSAVTSCDPYAARAVAPEIWVGPTNLEAKIVAKIKAAKQTVLVMMYQFTRYNIRDALIDAHKRGISVKVLLDGGQAANTNVSKAFTAAGVPWKATPTEFNHSHSKIVWIDGAEVIILSGNFNSYTMNSERNYIALNKDPQDLTQIKAIFDRDWKGSGGIDLKCSRLIVSPLNSRKLIEAHVKRAKKNLDLAVMYVSDKAVKTAVLDAKKAGINVRVLLAHPGWISDNTATAAEFKAAGIPAKFLTTNELHAKLVVSDGVPLVGSHNMSYNSITNNREIGIFVNAPASAKVIQDQFEADWKVGVTP